MATNSDIAGYRASNKASAHLALWTFAWVATVAVARFGPDGIWDTGDSAASWVAVMVNVLVGVGWIVAFARFLRALDDLWRRIMHDALTAALGVGWVTAFAYVTADAAGLIGYDVGVAQFAVLLGVVYLIVVVAGWIRYR